MLPPIMKKELEKQGYRIVGQHEHSAVKTCGWTKNMINGEGGCYKFKFYGIKSHQCMQMTTNMACANRCEFCWRDYKAPVSKEWNGGVDDPIELIDASLTAHKSLLYGFRGSQKANKVFTEQALKDVRHVALSLTGEPITYPRINEMIQEFHSRKISTFLVTNAQYPEAIKNLAPVTQLYVSVDAPNKELLKEIDKPLFSDYWERFLKSLDYLKEKEGRTVIRLTLVKGKNMCDLEGYAALITRGDPDFIEVKAYMSVGASQERLGREYVPAYDEVKAFGLALVEHLPAYEYVSDHEPSQVILLAKKSFGKKTWIDFDAFFRENNSPVCLEHHNHEQKTHLPVLS
ncbi:MAG: 4-demethylwyosine synthase TYW1 [Nanoarchaeota archaeon]